MSLKLSKLKEWLTLEDAAKSLSLMLSEDVKKSDLLQLALERKLLISLNLLEPQPAMMRKEISISDTEIYRVKGKVLKGEVELLDGEEKESVIDQMFNIVGPIPSVMIFGKVLYHSRKILSNSESNLTTIAGLWDLSMEGAECLCLEKLLFSALDMDEGTIISIEGVLLKSFEGEVWMELYDSYSSANVGLDSKSFYPLSELPSNAILVIRQSELQRFISSIEDNKYFVSGHASNSFTEETLQYLLRSIDAEELPFLDVALMAWLIFWKERQNNDKKCYPLNTEVEKFVKEKLAADYGITKDVNAKAKYIATMIRPSWAPKGRQSQDAK